MKKSRGKAKRSERRVKLLKKTDKKCFDFIGKKTEKIHNGSTDDVKKHIFTVAIFLGFYFLGRLTRLII